MLDLVQSGHLLHVHAKPLPLPAVPQMPWFLRNSPLSTVLYWLRSVAALVALQSDPTRDLATCRLWIA